jgi:hypothetical protein
LFGKGARIPGNKRKTPQNWRKIPLSGYFPGDFSVVDSEQQRFVSPPHSAKKIPLS